MRALFEILLVSTLFVFSRDLEAQSFKVLVLDAVSGKPQRNIQVHFYCRDAMRNYAIEEDDTDSEGAVIIPYTCKGEDPSIVSFLTGLPKEQCGSSEVVATIKEIFSAGIISAPDAAGEMQCTTKISGKLKPVPGQVIIIVKKPSWWQSHF